MKKQIELSQVIIEKETILSLSRNCNGCSFVIPFREEEFEILSNIFKIWKNPRSHFQHALLFHWHNNQFILVDVRKSSFLSQISSPNISIISRDTKTIFLHGLQNESCHQVCQKNGGHCNRQEFSFLNQLEVLIDHFEKFFSCKFFQIGIEDTFPGITVDSQTCIIREDYPVCEGSAQNIVRLCPCSKLN